MTLYCDHHLNELHITKTSFSVAAVTISMPALKAYDVIVYVSGRGCYTPSPRPASFFSYPILASQGLFTSMVHRSHAITKAAGTIS